MNLSDYFSKDYSKVALPRTRFNMPFQHETAFNTGDIIPLQSVEIYPGDEFKTKVSYLLRLFTPLKQIFSNMFIEFHAFFVPNRLTWNHWVNFCGQNDSSAWTETNVYTVPKSGQYEFAASSGEDYQNLVADHYLGTLRDYFGINPTKRLEDDTEGGEDYRMGFCAVNDLFRRGYINIWNEWYRDQNVQAPILFSKDDNESPVVYGYDEKPLKAAKFHDYFTTLLPEPMKGTPPVIGSDLAVVPKDVDGVRSGDKTSALYWRDLSASNVIGNRTSSVGLAIGASGKTGADTVNGNLGGFTVPSNLWATMTTTIEDIRNAAVATHVMEKLAESGSRYPEFLQGIWGVTSSNAELQIPELLGALRFPITIQEVVSNSDTFSGSSGEILGATGAMVKTGNSGALFNKAFTEYGILYVMGVIRIEQSYFQGLDRKWTRSGFFSYYNPLFQGIGNQPVYKYELLSSVHDDYQTTPDESDDILGYSEAFAHERHIPYRVSSIMRPDVPLGLSYWNASEIYDPSTGVSLNGDFIQQSVNGLDRCLAVPSSNRASFQWFGEFKFNNTVTRIIGAHGYPGLGRI